MIKVPSVINGEMFPSPKESQFLPDAAPLPATEGEHKGLDEGVQSAYNFLFKTEEGNNFRKKHLVTR